MISRLRQWFKTKASYEAALLHFKKLCAESETRLPKIREHYNKRVVALESDYKFLVQALRTQFEEERWRPGKDWYKEYQDSKEENEDLKQQIITLTANGITLKNELDEFKREI